MKYINILLYLLCISTFIFAQEEEPILYFQLEPLDDSLFINIQEQLFIDPPDPKAEIIADLRNANNQTISIAGTLYPFLALKPETRARIITYPFKINLEETITYSSVFTRVIEKLRLQKILNPPSVLQISSGLGYINPFLQAQGGERFGFPIKRDIGISLGLGTPYSGVLETNFIEMNFHILGVRLGIFRNADAFIEIKDNNNHNNLIVTEGIQVAYTIPFGNFFEVGYWNGNKSITQSQYLKYTFYSVNKDAIVKNPDGSIRYQPYIVDNESFLNWEFRYPVKVLGATRGKVYVARYLDELHIGFNGREMTLGGSVFDLRFDAMVNSPARPDQYVCDIIVQKIFDMWAASAIAVGPGFILSDTKSGSLGFTSFLFNLRIKVGTSL
ncbi:MAG: hypothetical protein HZC46_14415 [Ignavibacterium album]|uniref:hypothetical protein n=1 Tax=Ignavibacterium album TaxID=591197 RepID=UPI0026EACFBB|nr:hypothetical protein [Ignavibacterium album]MBI5663328.1 hypothetical protein [Ignavibacterium album]